MHMSEYPSLMHTPATWQHIDPTANSSDKEQIWIALNTKRKAMPCSDMELLGKILKKIGHIIKIWPMQ